jgi:LPS sulfotransferase NodH
MLPARSYLICASPRSGSGLLAGVLRSSGVAGSPEEYFWRGDMPAWRERWGVVLLAQVEEWVPPVPLSVAVARIDPTGSNPYVQANAKDGFPTGVVGITDFEYETVLEVHAERSNSTD